MANTKRAKLGMRVYGSTEPGPMPGSPAFGERARTRGGRGKNQRGRIDVQIQQDPGLALKDLVAKRRAKDDGGVA